MRRPSIMLVLALAALHACVALGASMLSFTAVMARFDGQASPPSYVERVSSPLANVLVQPMKLLWDAAAMRDAPDAFEWVVFLSNSALWGFALGVVVTMLASRIARERP